MLARATGVTVVTSDVMMLGAGTSVTVLTFVVVTTSETGITSTGGSRVSRACSMTSLIGMATSDCPSGWDVGRDISIKVRRAGVLTTSQVLSEVKRKSICYYIYKLETLSYIISTLVRK